MQRNRLAGETSPYLLQHADNPVDWYPWGEAALHDARQQNKPILLSIGYSACHWCHVMAHESFEDPATAALMNRLFINIKVDREERPDLDKIYQIAQQLITQRGGGWPLTMFLVPQDQKPFFGGTYFPDVARGGMPAFKDILQRVSAYFTNHALEISEQNAHLDRALEQLMPRADDGVRQLDLQPLQAARVALEHAFDNRHGGFGRAPKFPQVESIQRCLRHWYATSHASTPDLKALYMATLTLTRMAEGGLYDQLGGGFARYSVDDAWQIPHFEKMLYDNGPLLECYALASLATGESFYAEVAAATADWLLRDMRAPQGGFYSSLDADSAGSEGSFYVWDRREIAEVLTPSEYRAFAQRFGLNAAANFEGRWHLHIARAFDPDDIATPALIDAARSKLLKVRNGREWPALDDKVLTSWNALAIKGLAAAGRALARPDYIAAAQSAVDFIRRELWRDGRLLASWTRGRAHIAAYLDDYVFLADALLAVLQARWRSEDLQFARELMEVVLDQFADPIAGGFYFTAADQERLMHRPKSFSDDATPSGNGIAAAVFCRLGYLLAETRYLDAAQQTLQAAAPMLSEYPQAHMSCLDALQEFVAPGEILIIRGTADDSERWCRALDAVYAPRRMLLAIPNDAENLPDAIAAKRPGRGTTAYVCTGTTCSAPLTDLGAVARSLSLGIKLQ